jgi:ribonuclease-3
MPDYNTFEKLIGLTFKNKNLLMQAFTHRSYLNEHLGEMPGHNERLEFLGDAVLELVVTDYLFREHPEKSEGELTSVRAAVVNTNSLSFTAKEIGLNDYLLLSKGEAKDAGKARDYILANTVEALIGAIYLDQGYAKAAEFINSWLIKKVPSIILDSLWQDPKSLFQERAQEKSGVTPAYRVLKESGPDHDKQFIVGVFLGDEEAGQGTGSSKQEAEREAAENALKNRKWS